jgi:hypothetical protein
MMQLAMYKGPAKGFLNNLAHYAICIFDFSKYSHCELVIHGKCYSSSFRDGGVREKTINLNDGHWDLYSINGASQWIALDWFYKNKGKKYDWRGIIRFMLPFVKQKPNEFFCCEAVMAMLGVYEGTEDMWPSEVLTHVIVNH